MNVTVAGVHMQGNEDAAAYGFGVDFAQALDNFGIGFAAETENVLAYAREKRIKKKIPMIVANDVSIAMGKSTNRITIIGDDGELSFPETSKDEAAMWIVERLAVYLDK